MSAEIKSAIGAAVEAKLTDAVKYIDFRALMDVVAVVLADGSLTQDDFDAVADYVEELFDQHVEPYDIPNIGPLAETFVDQMLRRLIRPALQLLFDKFVNHAGDEDSEPEGGTGPIVSI